MVWEPQPGPQSSAILADWCDELFYGGERGGGKSDYQLGYQEDGALRYADKWRGIMFRKTYPELEELQARASEVFPAQGAQFRTQASAEFPFSNSWYWSNGATVKMRYIEHERDYGRYHGHQYTGISFDEVTEYPTPDGLLKMISTLRSAHGVPCTVRLTGNPGGVGHFWVRQRYIDVAPPYTPYVDPETGFTRMFIPSALRDNQILLDHDPDYLKRILAATTGNEALRKAWTKGDWNIVAGAFFDCWDQSRHVIRPFEIPAEWLRFRAGDWGSARPFSFGWYAVVGDTHRTPDGHVLPRGCLVRFKEWYGVQRDSSGGPQANIGLKLTARLVGKGLVEREQGIGKIDYGVIDPSAFIADGGPSIAEEIYSGSERSITFRPADNARVAKSGAIGGWDQMRSRLMGDDDGLPMLVIFSTCTDAIRTVPVMQHDANRMEDLDTTMEDHAADEIRYACMSRPYIKPLPKIKDNNITRKPTLNEVLALHDRKHAQRRRL